MGQEEETVSTPICCGEPPYIVEFRPRHQRSPCLGNGTNCCPFRLGEKESSFAGEANSSKNCEQARTADFRAKKMISSTFHTGNTDRNAGSTDATNCTSNTGTTYWLVLLVLLPVVLVLALH